MISITTLRWELICSCLTSMNWVNSNSCFSTCSITSTILPLSYKKLNTINCPQAITVTVHRLLSLIRSTSKMKLNIKNRLLVSTTTTINLFKTKSKTTLRWEYLSKSLNKHTIKSYNNSSQNQTSFL